MVSNLTAAAFQVGIWEITPGVVTDVEADEFFVVLAGQATLTIEDDGTVIYLRPGSLVRLSAGMRTRWHVTETLRKVYLAPA